MRKALSRMFVVVGVAALILFLWVRYHSEVTPSGHVTSITLGAFDPWLESVDGPGKSGVRANFITRSACCGLVALVCCWGYRRVTPETF